MSSLEQCLQSLDRFAQYGDDWDGYGAFPIPPEIIAAARTFLLAIPENLLQSPGGVHVAPSANSTIQLEWGNASRFLELEFVSGESIEYIFCVPGMNPEVEHGFLIVSDVKTAVTMIEAARNTGA